MSTITLQNFRVGSDLTVKVRLKDGGVAIDWSTLSGIRAVLYSDAQSSIAGRCDVTVDGEDPTLLVCRYAATKMQYLGVNRIVVSAKYMGMTKTYDKPAFTFVRWTEDQAGEEITIEDPEVTVEIDVEDVSSSILQEAVDAAFSAADRANEAAEAAEHMVDIHTGPKGDKGDTGETPDISIGTVTTVEPGTPAAASMGGTPEAPVLNLSIPKGAVGATPNFTVGTVTTGQPGTPVVITITGTAEAPVLNVTIPQGLKGDTGVSADYPITIHNGLDSDATDEALAAAQGKILDGKVSQLEAKVTDLHQDPIHTEDDSIVFQTEDGETIAEVTPDGVSVKALSIDGQDVSEELDNKMDKGEFPIENVQSFTDDDSIIFQTDGGETVMNVTPNGVSVNNLQVAGKDYNEEMGGKMDKADYPISPETIGDENDSISFEDNNENEIAKVYNAGVRAKDFLVQKDGKTLSLTRRSDISQMKHCHDEHNFCPDSHSLKEDYPILFKANLHTAVNAQIVNAVFYPNGEIIAAKSNGVIVKISNDGNETTLLTISGSYDWRCLFIDSNLNIYASPSGDNVALLDRGLYRLEYGAISFEKVISLYNPDSLVPSETVAVNSSIWTVCEDGDGYLYAGVYQNQTPWNPAIYRSTDGGETWDYYYNFLTICPSGHHIHFITYNEFDRALYVTVGEYNDIFRSIDHGTTWQPLGVQLEAAKGCSVVPTDTGLAVGSDSGYSGIMHKVYADFSHHSNGRIWANVVFAVRKSDITGWLYAFTINDASVDSTAYMPPVSAITSEDALNTWIASNPQHLSEWQEYNDMTKDVFPDDAVRPQHCAILISKNDGETWEILYKENLGTSGGVGFPIAGTFRNGECVVCVRKQDGADIVVDFPIVISEGKHKYDANGISIEGNICSKLVSSNNITRL